MSEGKRISPERQLGAGKQEGYAEICYHRYSWEAKGLKLLLLEAEVDLPVIEERGLALVNLTDMEYYMYKQANNKVERRKIGCF
ncbi:hypothetical protein [Paenibacillus donghaensis]|uniref:Uncharacterized protein n=1 Tax=Paenibacillus donghaensis TaxID=414771 RepID=A0A2Z2KRH8_9BACL|nr:hypothetical protein [Paenibacillus donghaensis]ASA24052.1 hypothetical protein B9T62_26690 [Paenibacillus donghaensis]